MSLAAFLALPVSAAPPAEAPNEQRVETVREGVEGAVRTVDFALPGMPQPQEWRLL